MPFDTSGNFEPVITILSPNGGENLIKGNNYTIRWTSQNITDSMQIDLYKGGIDKNYFLKQLAAAAPNTGSYPFNPYYGLINDTDYFIGISSMGGKISDFSNSAFRILDIPIVQQISPPNGKLGILQPVQFKWISTLGSKFYRLQFSADSTFATTIIDTIGLTDTTLTVSGLKNLTNYFWRVNASNTGGNSQWSQVWNFKTLGNPTQATLMYPGMNSSNIPVNVNFIWNQSQDQLSIAKKEVYNLTPQGIAKSSGLKNITTVILYWFQLSADTTSSSYISNDSTLADTTKLVSGLNNLTSYWWRVRAMNQAGWGTYTNWSKFTTIIDKPNVVQMVSPINNSIGNIQPVKLLWQSSLRASIYRLQFSTDSTFAIAITDTIGLTDTTFTETGLNNLTKYYWRVNASNVTGTSTWSSTWTFNTLGDPTQVVLIYPTPNSTNIPTSVNLLWNRAHDQINQNKEIVPLVKPQGMAKSGSSGLNNVEKVSKYWLQLMIDTVSNNFMVNDSTITDTTRLVSGLSHQTNYWWRVRAMNETGWQTTSNWINFVTIVDTPGVPTLLAPNINSAISATDSSVAFQWNSAANAITYELQITKNPNFNPIIRDTIGIADTIFIFNSIKYASFFYWRVRGSNIAGFGSWSIPLNVSWSLDGINNKNNIPLVYQLMQNYPNPFNPSSKIKYAIPFCSNVKIEIYNLLGEKIKDLVNEQKNTGYYEVNFNTNGLASGVYFYTIEAKSIDGKNAFRDVKKMVLLK